MKALTTMLAEHATAGQEAPADGLKVIRDAAQTRISEPVVDACSFSRPTSYSGNLAARQFGMLGRLAVRKRREVRAGGLPQHFVLAVTEHDVIALEETFSRRGGVTREMGAEVGRWARSALTLTTKKAGYLSNVTLSPGQGESIECCVSAGALTDSFLALLADPARQAAAG